MRQNVLRCHNQLEIIEKNDLSKAKAITKVISRTVAQTNHRIPKF